MNTGGARDGGEAEGRAQEFEAARAQLFAVAYRMLGSVADAEDVLQDAYLRWQSADRSAVTSAPAYLTTVVTRLCLDLLGSARVRREQYVGPWLPEPLVSDVDSDPADRAELADSLSMAFLVMLESLTPLERAAFLLREVFGYEYAEIARMLERDEAACRQLVSRAHGHVDAGRPRFEASREESERITGQFLLACATGDVGALMSLMSPDVVLWSDGGGVVSAARRPIVGANDVARFLVGIALMEFEASGGDMTADGTLVNGAPGAVIRVHGLPSAVMAFDVLDGQVVGVRIVRNPEKLTRVR
jgi:RNA polymerase sigma-70 factor (ECF subfamily)